ncbi:MAG: S8 family serine peptidase [candidate division Zixibacteria bacterium]
MRIGKLTSLIIAILLTVTGLSAADSDSPILSAKLDSMTTSRLSSLTDSLVDIVIFAETGNISSKLAPISSNLKLTRHDRIKLVSKKLREFQTTEMYELERFLNVYASEAPTRFWIVPAFKATLPVSKLKALEQFKNISYVVPDVSLSYDQPVESYSAPALSSGVSSHIEMLNVPSLWSRGLTGKGRLICSFDTGVEVGHPALNIKWRGHGTSLSTAWFSNVDPNSLPTDKVGHGTHTMGLMVGSDGADTIGVAFDAQWITAGVIDQGQPLPLTISDILAAFQWVLNPDGDVNTTGDVPDVILNSWGVPRGLFTPCSQTFWEVIDNVEAAGIVTVFAAGNEGPNPQTMRDPGDRAATPLNSFSVGAVDNNKVIGDFSSRGPSSCDTTQFKPEVVAPGVLVRSSSKDGGYGYMTGTSMAAPFIAGLVALIREYNPDATVEQIKLAIINSCEDLGAAGEDNAYGNGLPDASIILNFIPPPGLAVFEIKNKFITEGTTPFPGDIFHLQITLGNEAANVEEVTGTLSAVDSNQAAVTMSSSKFYFGLNSTIAFSLPQFEISFDSAVYHGEDIEFELLLQDVSGAISDTITFSLTAGVAPLGNIAELTTDRIDFSVSDFGQYGFAPGSIYNVGGKGLSFDGAASILYEAGIIVGRNSTQLSSSVRNSSGDFDATDFGVLQPMTKDETVADRVSMTSVMRDNLSEVMIPLTIMQKTTIYQTVYDEGFIIFEYWLKNNTINYLTSLSFGFFIDADISASGDFAEFDQQLQMTRQFSSGGKSIALVNLENVSGFHFSINGSSKRGFTKQEKFDLISSSNTDSLQTTAADIMMNTISGPYNMSPGVSIKVAFALAIGSDLNDLYDNVTRAVQRYSAPTDIDDDQYGLLPQEFSLNQNYPNPFNPSTTISFDLTKRGEILLEIYNSLGQKVKTLYSGTIAAGSHSFDWNGTDQTGRSTASGVYFYKLTTDAQTASMKMMLLK